MYGDELRYRARANRARTVARSRVARDACYKALAEVGKDSMHFRPKDEQNDYKVTCGVSDEATAAVVDRVNGELAAAGVSANVITSGHGGWKYLDIVPLRAGKLEALNHVRRHFGFSVASTVACGDSGNDILMLSGENLAIVVGNAQPDLRRWAAQRQGEEPALPNGKHRLLMASRKEALGILEGLEHFGFK
ncbi:putative sucrose-phosphatase 1 [Tetrabaena socialis]|uniref:Putative sucrose-phosphatase 1 n=1 Tax=Tetrabaena socialis TaxID=47790 RepID=A0A2J8A6P2_9CHLO|nr:putative sucrose-phosphatase 1 [Tetrabaena socialis]|eukprot:PNH08188.1 putative sucrose-phosphatase 1 [Tetrabaena socialis]